MALYPVSYLTGNPHLEALEIEQDNHADAGVPFAGFRDEEPAGPALTWGDIDRMWADEMERRDALTAVPSLGDDELIALAADDGTDPDLLAAALAEIVKRLDAAPTLAA